MIIGRTVIFIRQQWKGDRGVEKNLEYTGIVLDKFSRLELLEGRMRRMEYYQVELPDGKLAQFYCWEAVRVEKINQAALQA